MRASGSTCLPLFLLSCVAVAPLACHRADVSGQGAGARRGAPGGMGGGFNLPDGGPGGQGGGPAGAAGGSPGAPSDPGGEACAKEVHGAGRVPVDLLLLLDVSSSMLEAVEGGTRLKGELIREALLSFIEDPRSDGLGVGLRFFPIEEESTPPPTPTPPGMACQSNTDCLAGWTCDPGLWCWGERRGSGPSVLGFCSPDAVATTPPQDCGPRGICVEPARCALTGGPCYPPGQLCPGRMPGTPGMPGDMCEPQPRHCVPPPGPDLSCEAASYEKPSVAITSLPAGEAALTQALQNQPYSLGTPMGPALVGALAQARAHKLANPGHHVAVVLATDGFPESCEPKDAAGISALVAAGLMQSPPISTFAIGVFGQKDLAMGRPILEGVAIAGGTNKPFVLNSDPVLVQSFQDALEKIRQQTAVPCEFLIPRPNAPIDFAKVNVQLQDPAGTGENIPYVTSVDRCDPMKGGWYYDVQPGMAAPTRVLTCPATCDRLTADLLAKVSLVFGCRTVAID